MIRTLIFSIAFLNVILCNAIDQGFADDDDSFSDSCQFRIETGSDSCQRVVVSSLTLTKKSTFGLSLTNYSIVLNKVPKVNPLDQDGVFSIQGAPEADQVIITTTASGMAAIIPVEDGVFTIEPCISGTEDVAKRGRFCHMLVFNPNSNFLPEPEPLHAKKTQSRGRELRYREYTGDYLCTNGTLSVDSTFCCSKSCGTCSTISCSGSCCGVNITRSCRDFPAPCSTVTIQKIAFAFTNVVINERKVNALSLATQALSITNQAYANSRIPIQLQLHEFFNSTVAGDAFDDSYTLPEQVILNNYMNSQEFLNHPGADFHIIIYYHGAYCGLAWTVDCQGSTCIAVVNEGCITNYSFGHELAHLQGAAHNVETGNSAPDRFPYARGYYMGNTIKTRTVLCYPTLPYSNRINWFSNPSVSIQSGSNFFPTGSPNANTARALFTSRYEHGSVGDSVVVTLPSATIVPPVSQFLYSCTRGSTKDCVNPCTFCPDYCSADYFVVYRYVAPKTADYLFTTENSATSCVDTYLFVYSSNTSYYCPSGELTRDFESVSLVAGQNVTILIGSDENSCDLGETVSISVIEITSSPSKSPTNSPTKSPSTSLPSKTPSRAPTNSPTTSPSKSPSVSTPTKSPTDSPTLSIPTISPTSSIPTKAPSTSIPTNSPSFAPSLTPSFAPTSSKPTHSPTKSPSVSFPTTTPTTSVPTNQPTLSPSQSFPTISPSTSIPTVSPTDSPSISSPTISPTTFRPSNSPSHAPTFSNPTKSPTASTPTFAPSNSPSSSHPSTSPITSLPTRSPSHSPSFSSPTHSPVVSKPTFSPSTSPHSSSPTKSPTKSPTQSKPTHSPSVSFPTHSPSKSPTASPTFSVPSHSPTNVPSLSPTRSAAPTTLNPTASIVEPIPATRTPTSSPLLSLNCHDQLAFEKLRDLFPDKSYCAQPGNACQACAPGDPNRYIVCDQFTITSDDPCIGDEGRRLLVGQNELRITEIHMKDSKLEGVLAINFIDSFKMLKVLDLSNSDESALGINEIFANNSQCLSCSKVQCIFPKSTLICTSGGNAAGTVIAIIFILLLVIVAGYFYRRWKHKKNGETEHQHQELIGKNAFEEEEEKQVEEDDLKKTTTVESRGAVVSRIFFKGVEDLESKRKSIAKRLFTPSTNYTDEENSRRQSLAAKLFSSSAAAESKTSANKGISKKDTSMWQIEEDLDTGEKTYFNKVTGEIAHQPPINLPTTTTTASAQQPQQRHHRGSDLMKQGAGLFKIEKDDILERGDVMMKPEEGAYEEKIDETTNTRYYVNRRTGEHYRNRPVE